ncbi:MAG: hypothetical protein R3C49_06560 [Planctomycetaceae bacterium]
MQIQAKCVHSSYEQAENEVRAAIEKYQNFSLQRSRDESAAEFASKDGFAAAGAAVIQAINGKTVFDIGILTVDEALSHWLRSADSAALRPGMKVDIVGYPFDVEDPYFDSTVSIETHRMAGRILEFQSVPDTGTSACCHQTGG